MVESQRRWKQSPNLRRTRRSAIRPLVGAGLSSHATVSNEQTPAIRLQHVGLMRGQRWILRDIDWTVPAGACCAILGPNGAGKSTITRILAAHLWPTAAEGETLGGRFGET